VASGRTKRRVLHLKEIHFAGESGMTSYRGVFRGAALLLAAMAGNASAFQVFTVTRFDDPAPNGCLANDCSLREAVLAANALADYDVVVLGTGTYSLTSTVLVQDQVRILGVGPASTHVLATAPLDPLLQIDESTPTTLVLDNLSIDAAGGKEVRGIASSSLVLEFVLAPNPESYFYLGFGDGGVVNVFNSDIAGFFGFYGSWNAAIEDSHFGRLTIVQTDSSVNYQTYLQRVVVDGLNRTDGLLRIASLGEVSLAEVTVQNTNVGLYIDKIPELLTIDRLRYLDNGAPVRVVVDAEVTITRSEFRGNLPLSPNRPAALWVNQAGSKVFVRDSTFVGNTGTSDTGGAVLVEKGAHLELTNSTFVNNGFTVAAAAASARGAAVGYRSDPADTLLSIQNVTFVAPAVLPVGVEGSTLGGRGTGADVTLNLFNNIFDGSCRSDGVVPDFATGNIKTSGDNCGLGSGNLLGVSSAQLALGPLGDNGGITPTKVPGNGSVAIDGGNNFGCASTDQRGIGRPSGLRCDAGAVETGDVIFANGFN
jgi:CSLREA domain-containing protein